MADAALDEHATTGSDPSSHDAIVAQIAALAEANRAERDTARERRLVELRHEAFDTLEPEGPDAWPPPFEDLFPDAKGIPVIDGHDLTATHIGSAIQLHGALIVRGLIPEHHVRRLVDDIDHTVDAARRYFQEPDGRDALVEWFDPLGDDVKSRLFSLKNGGVFAADSPHTFFDLMEMFEEIHLVDRAQEYLGERPAVARAKAGVMLRPPDSDSAWHQDGSFLGERARTMNMWAALSPCGVDAPGLEVVPRRFDDIVDGFDMDDELVRRLLEETPPVQPVFEAGDAMLFDNFFLHRTGVQPGMTRHRYGIEWWFFARTNYPLGEPNLVL